MLRLGIEAVVVVAIAEIAVTARLVTTGPVATGLIAETVVALGVETGARLLAAVAGLLVAGRTCGRIAGLPGRCFLLFATLVVEERRVEIRLGFLDKAGAELVAQRAAAHLLGMALGQLAELERAVGNADQAVHVEAERTEHVLDLAVLAFAQTHGDPDIGPLRLVERRLDRAVEHAVDGDAFLQLVEIGLLDLAVGAHAVAAQPAGRRQFEHAGETAVIGQQQQAFGIDVEAADGQDARQVVRQVFEDRRAALRVGIGRHQAGRLVVEPEARALDAADRHAVHFDAVGEGDVDDGGIQHRAVHADAAFHDHALDIAARGHAGARQQLGNALGRQFGTGRNLRRRFGGAGRPGIARSGFFAIGFRPRLLAGCKGFLARGRRCGTTRLGIAARGLVARPFRLVFECHLCCLRFAVSYQVRRPGLRGIRAVDDKSLHGGCFGRSTRRGRAR